LTIKKIKKLQMKHFNSLPQVQSIIDNSGFIAQRSPSIDFPIPVAISYRANPDGSLRWIFPEGSINLTASNMPGKLNRLLFSLGLGKLIEHGRAIFYTDLPTATFIQTQWRKN
jgi:hypothetical protein